MARWLTATPTSWGEENKQENQEDQENERCGHTLDNTIHTHSHLQWGNLHQLLSLLEGGKTNQNLKETHTKTGRTLGSIPSLPSPTLSFYFFSDWATWSFPPLRIVKPKLPAVSLWLNISLIIWVPSIQLKISGRYQPCFVEMFFLLLVWRFFFCQCIKRIYFSQNDSCFWSH